MSPYKICSGKKYQKNIYRNLYTPLCLYPGERTTCIRLIYMLARSTFKICISTRRNNVLYARNNMSLVNKLYAYFCDNFTQQFKED